MPLTDTAIRNAKPKHRQYKLSDEKGLYLLVRESGKKYFRFDYRFIGKRKTLALGVYPDVSLAAARKKRDEARGLLNDGVDPSQHKREMKIMQRESLDNTNADISDIFQKYFKPLFRKGVKFSETGKKNGAFRKDLNSRQFVISLYTMIMSY